MQESYSNKPNLDPSKNEIFSKLDTPSEMPIFLGLDGRLFRQLSEKPEAEKPFDEKFERSLVVSARAIFQAGFDPALIFIASDELNILFLARMPTTKRGNKIVK